ncbi:hypothetical protein [Paludisphaera rhizosphaerae]|uniref:hypothetical protein n=1 Tax=Paludisphaera rhizosphaerae TaxID=2711216 RepID=UPI0013EC24F5|nr:hypothetical protein [Paludisphaera rhizosphaerae]
MEDPKGAAVRSETDRFVIDWAGDTWTLEHADGRMGLKSADSTWLHLAMAGLAATGRRDDSAFHRSALVGLEVVHSRLVATFEPAGWHGLTVRAAWSRSREGAGIDLEVQASASSVGELRRLEILVETAPEGGWSGDQPLIVEPRDRLAAGSTYDGREPAAMLARLFTSAVHPLDSQRFRPGRLVRSDRGPFVTMGHPQDVARWGHVEGAGGIAIRYALFGFDLEKGVVLRGRLREVRFAEGSGSVERRNEEYGLFVTEPPPLRTE